MSTRCQVNKVSKMSELVWTRWHVFVRKRSMKRNVPKPPKPTVWSYIGPVFLEGVFPECLCQSNISSVIFCQWHRSASKSQRPGVSSPANQNNSNDNNLVLEAKDKNKKSHVSMSSTKNYRNTTSLVTQGLERVVGLLLAFASDASVKTLLEMLA